MQSVAASTDGVAVRTQALFSGDSSQDWLPTARRIYALLRTGTCAAVLHDGAWGLSSVQQVSLPYLLATVRKRRVHAAGHDSASAFIDTAVSIVQGESESAYVSGRMVHGLTVNLVLKAHTMEWLTLARAKNLVKPLQPLPGAYEMPLFKFFHLHV